MRSSYLVVTDKRPALPSGEGRLSWTQVGCPVRPEPKPSNRRVDEAPEISASPKLLTELDG
jgi:hypothetical protein